MKQLFAEIVITPEQFATAERNGWILLLALMMTISFITPFVVLAPADAPTGISLAALNQSCVYFGWSAGPERTNGPITKYEVNENQHTILFNRETFHGKLFGGGGPDYPYEYSSKTRGGIPGCVQPR